MHDLRQIGVQLKNVKNYFDLQAIMVCSQGLSQDLETRCSKLTIVKFLGVHIFKGDHNSLKSTINMYIFIKIRHIILLHVMGIIWR